MVDFLKTRAKPGSVVIDTTVLAESWDEGKDLRPLWHAASAAFIVDSDHGPCVILVRRSGDTEFTEKWALLPAGGSQTIEELRRPSITLEREGREELLIWRLDGSPVDAFEESVPYKFPKVRIFDEATGEEVWEEGEVIPTKSQFLFMKAYKLKPRLEEIVIQDGEMRGDKPLDREIAVVRVDDDLHGKVMPVAMFRRRKRNESEEIDLSGYQTPTLDWFRDYRRRI